MLPARSCVAYRFLAGTLKYNPDYDIQRASIKSYIYTRPRKIPKGFNIPYLQHPSYVFTKLHTLLKILYGMKDDGSTQFDFLKVGLMNGGLGTFYHRYFLVHPNLVYNSHCIYVDDAILPSSSSKEKIGYEIESLRETFDSTDER